MEDTPLTEDEKIVLVTVKMCMAAAIATGQMIADMEPGADAEQTAMRRNAIAAAILSTAAKTIMSGELDNLDLSRRDFRKVGGIQ